MIETAKISGYSVTNILLKNLLDLSKKVYFLTRPRTVVTLRTYNVNYQSITESSTISKNLSITIRATREPNVAA